MKTILHWDPRFPVARPVRLELDDAIASAFVRAGVAAPANQADAAALQTGAALDPGNMVEIIIWSGTGNEKRRVFVPGAVAEIATAAGAATYLGLSGGTATPAPTPLLPSGLIVDMDPESLALSSGAPVAAWTDTINGIVFEQATTSAQPIFRTGGINGKPYLEFASTTKRLVCLNAGLGALKTALDGQEYTIILALGNSSGTGCVAFGDSDGTFSMGADATRAGSGGVGGAQYHLYTPDDYVSVGFTGTKSLTPTGTGGGNLRRGYVYGMPFSSATSAIEQAGSQDYAIGAFSGGASGYRGRLYRILVFNRCLSPAEMLDAELYLQAQFAQTHPIVTKGKVLLLDGDSRTAGVGASAADGSTSTKYAALVAAGLGYGIGTYGMYAIGGYTLASNITKGPEMDYVADKFPTAGVRLLFEEFYNSKSLAVGDIATAGTLAYQTKQYFDARRAKFGAGAKLVPTGPIDHTGNTAPFASSWNAWISGNWSSTLGADGFIDMWSTEMGGDNTCPASSPYTPWSDGVHADSNGQLIMANKAIADAGAISGF